MAGDLALVMVGAIVGLLIWSVKTISPKARGWQQALMFLVGFIIPFAVVGFVGVAIAQTIRKRRRGATQASGTGD